MSSIEPLRVLEGTHFTCHGDGLCCSDVHAWGPLDEVEALTLRAMDERVVVDHEGDLVIAPREDGRCVFSTPEGCVLHASLGPKGKPKSCQQFPYVLVATPTGGRVATEHRCPCRTMGERAPITPERGLEVCDVESIDRTIRNTVALDDDTEIDMHEWEAIEAPLLAGPIEFGEPPLTGGDWQALGRSLMDTDGASRFERALSVFGAAICEAPFPDLGWAAAFDAAEARSEERDPEEMLQEFVREAIWSLDWAFQGSWRQARLELATRMELARRIAKGVGGRPDRAMAEAIAVIELAGMADDYTEFVGQL